MTFGLGRDLGLFFPLALLNCVGGGRGLKPSRDDFGFVRLIFLGGGGGGGGIIARAACAAASADVDL